MCEWSYQMQPSFWGSYGVAVIGLAGVMIGSVISGAVAWGVAKQAEKAKREQEDANKALDRTVAARLVLDEMITASSIIEFMMTQGRWAPVNYSGERYKEYSPLLATLPYKDWVDVIDAYAAMQDVLRLLSDRTGDSFDGGVKEQLQGFYDATKAGSTVLYKYCLDGPKPDTPRG